MLYLYRIAVDVDSQKKGIGQLIIKYCKDYGVEHNKKIYLDCWEGNKKLRNFYEGQGLTYINDYMEGDYFVSVYKL